LGGYIPYLPGYYRLRVRADRKEVYTERKKEDARE
jgi:hypothetical protein